MKKLFITFLIIVICILLYLTNQWIGGKQNAVEVSVTKVEKGTMIMNIQANGVIEPGKTTKVRMEVEGNVLDKLGKDGAKVKQGDILLEVDKEKLKKDVLDAEVNLTKAKNNLKNLVEVTGPYDEIQVKNTYDKSSIAREYSKKNQDSMQRMYDQEIISRRQLEDAQRSYETDKLDYIVAEKNYKNQKEKFEKDKEEDQGEVQVAEANLKEAKDKLGKATVKAPTSGSIVEDALKEKRYVSIGDEIFTIGDISIYNAKVNVDELDIDKVKLGQTATISSEGFKDKKLIGHVIEIAAQATRQTFAEIEVKIAIDSTFGQPVRPNLSVDADIQTQKLENVLKVPVESVTKQDNKKYVFVIEGNHVKKREVTAGVSNPETIVIEKGLKEGDTIVQQGVGKLKDNTQIKIAKPKTTKK